jgi:hypothetical protein
MKCLALFLAVLCLQLPLRARDEKPAEPEPSAAHRFVLLAGKIGDKAEVRAQLQLSPGEESAPLLMGSYHYVSQGKAIFLNGNLENDTLKMEESVPSVEGEKVTGRFQGRWEGGEEGKPVRISGTWTSGDGQRKLPFTLQESAEAGSVALEFHFFEESYARKRGDASFERSQSLLFPQLRDRSEAAGRINAAIRRLALAGGESSGDEEEQEKKPDPSAPAPSLSAIEASVRADIPTDGELAETDFSYSSSLTYHDEVQVRQDGHGLLCLRLFHTEYTGGAHGNHGAAHVTFDLATGKEVRLDDLFKPGVKDQLTRLAEATLREEYGLKPDDSLSGEGPLFEDKFELNDNWFVTPVGLGFSYDPYEIGPYAAGFIEPMIPFAKLKDLLKDGSPLERFGKKAQ